MSASFTPDPSWPSIVELATQLWGPPNKALSSREELRFGSNGSKSVKPRAMTWFDHEAGEGGGYVDLHLKAIGPLPPRPKPGNGAGGKIPPWQNIGTIYHYLNADGDLVLDVIRTLTGTPRFVQRRPDASAKGGWRWSVRDIPPADRPLYRLPGLRASGDATVWITEGEKDADRLHNELLIATCNIGGASKWRAEYANEFRDKPVVILPDNDQAGRDHAATVARSLIGVAASIKVLLLPGLPPKGDVSDWLDAGGTVEELERLAQEAPEATLLDIDLDGWPEPVDILADHDTGAPILTADHVPPALWPFVKDTAERMGVATSSVALAAIVSCCAVISEEWNVQPKAHDYLWTEQSRLWGAILGPPSILKSPVVAACTAPVDHMERAARHMWHEDVARYDEAMQAWKATPKKDRGPEPKFPLGARYMVEDTSIEALQEVLRDRGGRHYAPQGKVLVRRDELSEFLASMDRYSTSKTDDGAYLRLYNGGRFSIDRIGRGSFVANSWSGCILGGIQPDPIQRIAARAAHDGLLQRFMYDVPAQQTGGLDRAPDYPAIVAYRDLFPALAALRPAGSGDATNRHEVVVLHRDAHAAREDISLLAAVMAVMPNASKQLQSALGKWPGTFARLCLTFHLIEIAAAHARGDIGPPVSVVSADTANRVQRYMRAVLAPNLLRADATMFSSQQSEHAAWIAGYILAGKLTTITAREIAKDYRALKAPEQRDALDSTMLSLCVVGWLEAEAPANPAKPPTRWQVNPRVHIRFAERAEAERKRREAVREAIAKHVASVGNADPSRENADNAAL